MNNIRSSDSVSVFPRRGNQSNRAISSIEEVLEDYRQGKMVIMVDDENRENEGDLIIAASTVRTEDINFMAWHGRGLICLTLTQERCRQLDLPLMTQNNNARYATNFTVSIEASQGVTTGISASDRAKTVWAAVKADAKPEDIVSPGHIFPIMADPGGVLSRAGHTEAGVDLARLSGFEPASVICEILKEDGSLARLPDLVEFSKQHQICIGTIASLIRHRLENEPTVHRVAESALNTQYGAYRVFVYQNIVDNRNHIAMVKGQPSSRSTTAVRVHSYHGISDVLADIRGEQSWSIRRALEYFEMRDTAVLVILCYDQIGNELVKRIRHDQIRDLGMAGDRHDPFADLRMLGVGSQILSDIGVGNMAVLGHKRKVHGLSGFGLEIEKFVAPDFD